MTLQILNSQDIQDLLCALALFPATRHAYLQWMWTILDVFDEALPGVFDRSGRRGWDEDDEDGDDEDAEGEPAAHIQFGGAFFDEDLAMGGEVAVEEHVEGAGRAEEEETYEEDDDDDEVDGNINYDNGPGLEPPPDQAPPPLPAAADGQEDDDDDAEIAPPTGRAHVERALRQEVHVRHFPSPRAGEALQRTETMFGTYNKDLNNDGEGDNIFAPFKSERDFQIARWAKMRGPGSTAFDELLKIPGVREDLGLSFKNTREINKVIDEKLPSSRPRFRCKEVLVAGEVFHVYYRDALQCVKALYGDPNFAADLVYAPEQHYADEPRFSLVPARRYYAPPSTRPPLLQHLRRLLSRYFDSYSHPKLP
ncbi:hypothetical protein EUX98_g1829, partial [Antrodiella citrinella]